MGHDRKNDKSILFFELDSKKKLTNLKAVKLYERVRDLIFHKNSIYLFFEDSPSIGVISMN